MLDPNHCKIRQRRLLNTLAERKLAALVLTLPHHVYYFSAHLPIWQHQAAFLLFPTGESCLIAANNPPTNAAADEIQTYEAQWLATLRQEQPETVAQQILDLLTKHKAKHIGIDTSAVSSHLALSQQLHCEVIDPILWHLRRKKDSDELALMKTAIHCTEAMYARARQIIAPGIAELDVFTELHSVAVKTAGEPLRALLGNDFACGAGGGPPRKDRTAKAGELYVLDLGPCYRGYFADNCRTLAVNGEPTAAQKSAWQAVTSALTLVEQLARPGARCRDIYQAVIDHMLAQTGNKFAHHLGHGVGLQPHEFPHLNPKWDDILMEGDFFTAEPGLYSPDLAGGIRIENNYLVTATGVENLLSSPMELT